MRILLLPLHYGCMQSSYRRLPHHYAICRTTICHIPSARQSANRVFPSGRLSSGKAFACLDRLLDEQRAGPAYLRMPAIAEVVADAIGQGTASDYLLHAWVVMPNHVHLLITPQVEVPALLRRVKGASARESNKLLGQTGRPFWQDESYDRLVRNDREFDRIRSYIENNPVTACLAARPEEYVWSSAGAT